MLTKIVVGVLAAVGVTFGGVYYASAKSQSGCCFPGSECCYPGSPCCAAPAAQSDCCSPTSDCCFPGSPCCVAPVAASAPDCCFPGSPCCANQESCCLNQPVAKVETAKKSCCEK